MSIEKHETNILKDELFLTKLSNHVGDEIQYVDPKKSSTHDESVVSEQLILENQELKDELIQSFNPKESKKNVFLPYIQSNEYGYQHVIRFLDRTTPILVSGIRVALLFGESNFLSIMPELSMHADLILLADIEGNIHAHNQHLLNCFDQSNNIGEFCQNYEKNNPIEKILEHTDKPISLEKIYCDNFRSPTLKNYCFLSDTERFNQCKESYKNLSFFSIHYDLGNQEKSSELAHILNQHGAKLTLCNFTNIHDYIPYKILCESVQNLLKYSENYFIMYSEFEDRSRTLCTTYSSELSSYFEYVKAKYDKFESMNIQSYNDFLNQLNMENLKLSQMQFLECLDAHFLKNAIMPIQSK